MIQKISKTLNQPFPEVESPKQILQGISLAAVIVFMILFFFKPFGLAQIEKGAWWISLCFGIITFVVGISYEYLMTYSLPLDRQSLHWTLKHWIISTIGLILCIAMANYVFLAVISHYFEFNWKTFIFMIGNTFSVAIVPTIIAGLIVQNRNLKRNLKSAAELQEAIHSHDIIKEQITIVSDEQDDSFNCSSDALYYVEAMQNYINIYYKDGDDFRKFTLRNSLKSTCEQICSDEIVKCHRSYIVNTTYIQKVSGNAQGLSLHLPFDRIVPVSRSFIKKISEAIDGK